MAIAIGSVLSLAGSLFGGGKPKRPTTTRVDGAKWSAAKQYWELPAGVKAVTQSPKPTGEGQQSMTGGPAQLIMSAPIWQPTPPPPPTSIGGQIIGIAQQAGLLPPTPPPPGATAPPPAPALPSWVLPVAVAGVAVLLLKRK